MKLKRLYIENFGGLSAYSLGFSDGLTVVCEPNGFGKTTLAEFIRAMFYGFPRKAKTLERSRRQKYLPWNGKKCGGNLVFEQDGTEYRIERTFGLTPRTDTFCVIDLKTNTKTDRFPTEIGTVLFGLDADSYARSTYLPQLREDGPLTTDSIRAKLSDLVEDANDIGNFEKAMNTLRTARSTFIPYRGNGGSVSDASAQITLAQEALARAQAQETALASCREVTCELEERLAQDEAALKDVRAQITASSQAAAGAAVHGQYDRLVREKAETDAHLSALQTAYPAGLPANEEIEAAAGTARQLDALRAQQMTLPADLEAARIVTENRERFASHVPTQAELDEKRREAEAYRALDARAAETGLAAAEAARFDALLRLHDAGALEEAYIERLDADSCELEKLRSAQRELSLSPDERAQCEALQRYFAPGVPDEEALLENRQKLACAQQLRHTQTPAPQIKKTRNAAVIPAVLGVLPAIVGAVLLAAKLTVPGAVLAVLGVLALIGAGYLSLRQMLARELGAAQKSDAAQTQADALEREVCAFTASYTPVQPPQEALSEIGSRRTVYLTLMQRRKTLESRRAELSARAQALDASLRDALGDGDVHAEIMNLRRARTEYAQLLVKKEHAEAQLAARTAERRALEEKLTSYLGAYATETPQADLHGQVVLLARQTDEYRRACAHAAEHAARIRQHEEALASLRAELDGQLSRWGLTAQADAQAQLQRLRDDRRRLDELTLRARQLGDALEAFRAEHGAVLAAPVCEAADTEALKQEEACLNAAITELTRQLLQQRQTAEKLRAETSRIPALRDEEAYWQTEKAARQQKAAVLDETMDYLQRAKESLSASYLGPISRAFRGYLGQLAGTDDGGALITPELEILLEREGQSRELAYFSAGQNDLVGICMRLALVDALFGDETMFVILDDPFINLDDAHTAAALSLLQGLSRQRQILYLVCNTARNI